MLGLWMRRQLLAGQVKIDGSLPLGLRMLAKSLVGLWDDCLDIKVSSSPVLLLFYLGM